MLEKNPGKLLTDLMRSTKAVLIVVDVQNDFCHSEGAFSKKNVDLSHIQKIIVPNIVSLIRKCRKSNLPIIFIRTIHSGWTNSPSWQGRIGGMAKKTPICLPDSWGAKFYKVKPDSSDCIVTKHRYSAFTGTDLDLILRSKGIETVLICGVATNVCVETTARDGFNLNYNVILIEDCCGAFSLEEHESALNSVRKYFGNVTESKGLMKILGRGKIKWR